MTALSCPACGLKQTLAAPRCARCGAPLDGSMPPVPPVPTPATGSAQTAEPDASVPDDRTVLRDALTVPPGSAALPGWATPGPLPTRSARPGMWQRLRRRLTGAPRQPEQPEPPDPSGG